MQSKINWRGSKWVQKQRGRWKYEDIGRDNEDTRPEQSPDLPKQNEGNIN